MKEHDDDDLALYRSKLIIHTNEPRTRTSILNHYSTHPNQSNQKQYSLTQTSFSSSSCSLPFWLLSILSALLQDDFERAS